MAEVKTEYVEIPVSDGTTMRAYVARPQAQGPPRPGLMVFQEAFGVNAHIRSVASRFAEEGYVAIAPELFHRTSPGFEGRYGDFDTIRPIMQTITTEGLEADVQATFDWLARDASVDKEATACTGYCMGGRVSWIANSLVPVKAAVSYYGGGIAPGLLDRVGRQQAPFLMFWGGLDQHIPPEQIRAVEDALRDAGKTYANVVFSDADHGFFCDERPAYNARAARQSWSLVLTFLQDCLASPR